VQLDVIECVVVRQRQKIQRRSRNSEPVIPLETLSIATMEVNGFVEPEKDRARPVGIVSLKE
jgi:hypothetical protein